MSACKACGAPVEWVHTEKGKAIPLDVGVVENGNLRLDGIGPRRVARYVAAGEGDRVTHFATCPNADEFRKR